jgi:hypothetical protein
MGLAGRSAAAAELTDLEAARLQLPAVGDCRLRVLTPQLLELTLITTEPATGPTNGPWDFVDATHPLKLPAPGAFKVSVGPQDFPVSETGFKRRVVYAPLEPRDLRIGNWLYLRLATPLPDGAAVRVTNPDGALWGRDMVFQSAADPLRWNPAIHINQTGYLPNFPKVAMVGYFLGSLGELDLPAAHTFEVLTADTGRVVLRGELQLRPDAGFKIQPAPYQRVWSVDFSALTQPGSYRLRVPGLGASEVFAIDEGEAANWARAVALGLYHQRCGTNLSLPFTRFTHGVCHARPAEVPTPQFAQVEHFLAGMTSDAKKNPRHTAPPLSGVEASLYPFVNPGPVDVSGGHHDAGDYGKYTINSAAMIHFLVFAVDAFPGVAGLDNLGLPESGDGRSDLLQEAKWEADFLAKMQDADGGFYFLVYPRDRKYENNVPPDEGDPQVVYPKNTAATAAAVAALAQAGSSPAFRREFPGAATNYAARAAKGWAFLERAIAAHGRDGAYQKLTHYGDVFMHDDELAWAATEMFLATGDPKFQIELQQHFDPTNRTTRHWTWERMFEGYGCAIRSYAFAARTGRLDPTKLDPAWRARCESEIKAWADDNCRYAGQCAYGTSYPDATKRFLTAGWFFSTSRAFDLAVAWQLEPRPEWLRAILGGVNYELGNNPVNVCYITGLGNHPARELVNQFALNSRRRLPPSGLLVGNLQDGFQYLDHYGRELGALSYPPDGAQTNAYPMYDRWGESFNPKTETVIVDQARSLATLAFLMTQTADTNQAWRCASADITGAPKKPTVGRVVQLNLTVAGLDLTQARVVWEAADREPYTGRTLTLTPAKPGPLWVEAEAAWPDGRRAFAATNLTVSAR